MHMCEMCSNSLSVFLIPLALVFTDLARYLIDCLRRTKGIDRNTTSPSDSVGHRFASLLSPELQRSGVLIFIEIFSFPTNRKLPD